MVREGRGREAVRSAQRVHGVPLHHLGARRADYRAGVHRNHQGQPAVLPERQRERGLLRAVVDRRQAARADTTDRRHALLRGVQAG